MAMGSHYFPSGFPLYLAVPFGDCPFLNGLSSPSEGFERWKIFLTFRPGGKV